jgi:hypothetical protein
MMRSASNFSLALMSVSASLRVTSSGVKEPKDLSLEECKKAVAGKLKPKAKPKKKKALSSKVFMMRSASNFSLALMSVSASLRVT